LEALPVPIKLEAQERQWAVKAGNNIVEGGKVSCCHMSVCFSFGEIVKDTP